VIGAAVNLACRLESLTRRFPDHPILISSELRALLPPLWPEPVQAFALGDPALPT
jgi:adenylate cyclase